MSSPHKKAGYAPPPGERHHRAKYSNEIVAAIKKDYLRWIRLATKCSPKAMSLRFGVPYRTVISLCKNQWRKDVK